MSKQEENLPGVGQRRGACWCGLPALWVGHQSPRGCSEGRRQPRGGPESHPARSLPSSGGRRTLPSSCRGCWDPGPQGLTQELSHPCLVWCRVRGGRAAGAQGWRARGPRGRPLCRAGTLGVARDSGSARPGKGRRGTEPGTLPFASHAEHGPGTLKIPSQVPMLRECQVSFQGDRLIQD